METSVEEEDCPNKVKHKTRIGMVKRACRAVARVHSEGDVDRCRVERCLLRTRTG
jgi:hypothetical protein